MSQGRVRPLLEYQFPEEELLVQGKDQTTRALSIQDYNQFFQVRLSHGIFYDTRYEKEIQALLETCSALSYRYKEQNLKLQAFLSQPKNYFSICYVNELCGYALVAKEAIPTGTVVGTYSSLLAIEPSFSKEALPLSERAYDMGLSDFSPIQLNGAFYDLTLRAKTVSDLTRFAIHLPSKAELAELEKEGLLGAINSKKVLTENIHYPLANYKGVPVRYYETSSPIKKGDLVGITYGSGYWKRRGRPCLLVREEDGIFFRVAYFDAKQNIYILSQERIATQKIEVQQKVEEPKSRSCSSFPYPLHRLFSSEAKPLARELTPQGGAVKPLLQAGALFSSQSKKRTIPHSQLPTQSSLFKMHKKHKNRVSSKREDLVVGSVSNKFKS
jgi:hypothetical protein